MSFDTQRSYAMELVLLADNDYQIYRSRVEPITKNLERKIAKGIFKKELAIKLCKYLMDDVAKKYAVHYGGTFTPSDRRLASAIWVDQFLANRESS
jgi:hypothetical protein